MKLFEKVDIKESKFGYIYIELTYGCNLKCNMCYNPYNKKDIDLDYFDEACSLLPRNSKMRFLGGEPTLKKQLLFDAIKIANKYNHEITIVSNGVRFGEDENFINELSKLRDKTSEMNIGISFDGGFDDELYKIITGRYLLDTKLKAIKNLTKYNFKHCAVCATIIKGLNEKSIKELYKVSLVNKNFHSIHFRTQMHFGRWVDDKKIYTIKELNEIIGSYIPEFKKPTTVYNNEVLPDRKCNNCCKIILTNENKRKFNIIDCGHIGGQTCHYRGLLNNSDFTLTSFFGKFKERHLKFISEEK